MSEKRFPKAYPYINENVTVDMFECPDCGFEYNAHHEMDDEEGGYECVLCSEANLQAEVERLQTELSDLRFYIAHLEEFAGITGGGAND